MDLMIKRTDKTDKSVIGELSINDCFECYTLEDPDGANDRIPAGVYQVILDLSNRFKIVTPHLLGNGYTQRGIRIHSGTDQTHTTGCILVGKEKGTDRLYDSRAAFSALMVKLKEPMTLTII